jgi:superfamily II DNA or RNA helicase
MEEKDNLLKKIENIDSQITLLSDLKKKLVSHLDDSPREKSISADLYTPLDFNKRDIVSDVLAFDKITLFRSLFRGREDVYPRFWVSRKTGKSGYSPVCKNEWVPKICKKPIMRCSECPNRELVPLDDEVIRKHLVGAYMIGIYPMLQDETCYFLAVDFDKEEWVDNIFSFKETCLQEGVPVAIERSRSGNGAHAWIFFKENISASLARRMGSFLITKTMSKRYKLSMKSYDRLFPNQDTLPKGGFGSLIALPFQKESVKRGNSVFIDESCTPYTNQWKFLSTLEKMARRDVERFSKEALRSEQIVGVRMSPISEKDPPWMRLPSGKRKYKSAIKDLPEKIELVVANRIYIKTEGLSSVLLNQIKQLAAFQNPEFYKRQNMRLSTFLTPRVISCSEILDDYLSIPRGCFEDVSCLLDEYGIKVDIKDERTAGKKAKFKFYGELNKEQKSASRKVLKKEIGVLVAPSGMGKTVIAIHVIAKRKTNTLILVHRKPLMEQWRLQLASFLGIDLKNIGQIGGGKNKSTGILDIAMIQSMERKGSVDDRIIDYGFVIADECHHISAVSFERVLMQAKAKYILGLTATPYRKDGHQPIIHMQCGPIRYQKRQVDDLRGISRYYVIPRVTEFSYEWTEESNIYDLWPKLITDEKRNRLIVNDVLKAAQDGRFSIVLTERIAHLDILAEMLNNKIEYLIVLSGRVKPKRRKEILEELSQASPDKKKTILATGAYIGEGFDNPQLDTLFITMPISFKGKIIQYAGRLHRKHESKTDVRIYDYVDENVSVLQRMYGRRLKTYKGMGYESYKELNKQDSVFL